MKQLIVFDLDGTLAVSKSSLDPEMAGLISTMLGIVRVADNKHFTNLSLLPTCGTKFYQYDTTWKLLYAENLTADEKQKIIRSLHQVADNADIKLKKGWGEIFEDRGSQITFSALGQQAAIEVKEIWDPDFAKRKRMKERLDQLIPEFSVRLGGTTSIDVTKPGIDKAHGIRKLCDILGIANKMIFIGDALFPGGNDYPAKEAGVRCIQVRDVEETKRLIEANLACLDNGDSESL